VSRGDVTGLGLAFGQGDQGRSWIGRVCEPRPAEAPVCEAMIRNYCALVEDGNSAYWDDGVSPPGLLMAYGFPAPWRPGGRARTNLFAMSIPLPGRHIINVSTDTEFRRHAAVGDHVWVADEVVDVSEAKRTRLGEGHFITTRSVYRVDDEELASNVNVLFRYDVPSRAVDSASEPVAEHPGLGPDAGEALPAVSVPVTYRRVCHNAAATWDSFPGHHDPEYARSQGQKTIYLSTLFFHGFLDRLVTEWAGRGAFIRRRKMRMLRSIYAGQTATATGHVTARRDEDGRRLAEVACLVSSEEGACVPAEVTVELPPDAGGAAPA
jgi:acyl dehydratase